MKLTAAVTTVLLALLAISDTAIFFDRRDPERIEDNAECFEDRAGGWQDVMAAAKGLHPIKRACMGFHLWRLAGLGQYGDRIEAAVTAVRVAASVVAGAIFAPFTMGGAGGLRASGLPSERLARWLEGMEQARITAYDIEAWSLRAETVMASLSGRTLPALRDVLTEWTLVSAPMAEAMTGASRAAVQRNLAWMNENGLVREVTWQGRFRMWRVAT